MQHGTVGWVAALALLGCGDPEPGDPTPGDPVEEPSPYVVDRPDDEGPTVSLREVERALQAGLDVVLDLDAAPVHAAYEAAMAGRTGSCPYEYVTPDGNYWFDSCSTDGGASYDGYVFAYAAAGVPDPYSGLTTDYWSAFGGAVIVDAEGHTLELSGAATDYHAYGDSGGVLLDVWYVDLAGTFRWDGPEARGTWLADGYDPDLTWQRTAVRELGAAGVYLAGGFSGLPDGWSIAFDENQVGHELLGYTCEDELSGTVSVRAPDGSWVDVRFDGVIPDEGTDPAPGACDGCGEAFAEGTSLGEVCVSLDTLLAKAVRP
jgi:hypothetical protein